MLGENLMEGAWFWKAPIKVLVPHLALFQTFDLQTYSINNPPLRAICVDAIKFAM